jgi:hypothetical protein
MGPERLNRGAVAQEDYRLEASTTIIKYHYSWAALLQLAAATMYWPRSTLIHDICVTLELASTSQ